MTTALPASSALGSANSFLLISGYLPFTWNSYSQQAGSWSVDVAAFRTESVSSNWHFEGVLAQGTGVGSIEGSGLEKRKPRSTPPTGGKRVTVYLLGALNSSGHSSPTKLAS